VEDIHVFFAVIHGYSKIMDIINYCRQYLQ